MIKSAFLLLLAVGYSLQTPVEDVPRSDLKIDFPEIVPEVPDVIPEVPEVLPDVPQVLPDVPQVLPDIPEVIPDIPEVIPDIPEVIPDIPQVLPDFPEVIPDIPEVIPDIPEVIPDIPEIIPDIPEVIPDVPEIPDIPEVPESFPDGECPEIDGDFPVFLTDLKNCSVFYQCANGVPYRFACTYPLEFNPTLQVCDFPYRAGCINDKISNYRMIGRCPQTATVTKLLRDSLDNTIYYECVNGVPELRNCPPDTVFTFKRICEPVA